MASVKSETPRRIQSPSPGLTRKLKAATAPALAHAPSKTTPKTSQGAPPWWPSGSKTGAGAKPGWSPQAKPTPTTGSAPQGSDPRDKYSTPLKGNDTQLATGGHQTSAAYDTTEADAAPAKLAGTRVGKKGRSRVSAGVSAERRGSTVGKYGSASYEATAKAEADAEISAKSKLNLNGLNAKANAHAGLTAEARLTGSLATKPYNLTGVPMTAGVEAGGKLSVTADLDARGQIQVTRNPPTAILQGSASASAVARAEGTLTGRLGPVGVTANGYLSAGAEAKSSGIAGYQDGVLRFGASAGASAGVGAGCGLQVNVDCSGKPADAPRRRRKTPRAHAHVHGGGQVGAGAPGAEKPVAKSRGG